MRWDDLTDFAQDLVFWFLVAMLAILGLVLE